MANATSISTKVNPKRELTFVAKIPEGAKGINFLLWPVVTNLVCFIVGIAVDRMMPLLSLRIKQDNHSDCSDS